MRGVLRYIVADRRVKFGVVRSAGGNSLIPVKFGRFSVSVAVSPHIYFVGRLSVYTDLTLVWWKGYRLQRRRS